ncbi:hypothetical protein Mag101_06860 [Microbulbifer agarilyticus]|uniref:Uncharacterized protein n=1 Tax=Microbulbifer agarilyticus TaxID=260552 RepID=A0A1Q2M3S7_9GAMM|nr:hypothetical protein [Microbulbifer agarilyticus]AQQ67385.1 hypothetical protein Mag101_06860 [Microbulbifer agarilyticus]
MVVNRGRSLLFAGLLGVVGWSVELQAASSLTVEQNRLARMEQVQENRLVELEDIENEIVSYEYKLERAQNSLSEARKNYQQSLVAVKTAEREHKGAASTDTARALKKAKHTLNMAERGVDSRNRRVEFIQSNYGELATRLADARESVAGGKSRLEAQQTLVDSLVKEMLNEAKTAKAKVAAKKSAPKPEVAPAVVISAPKVPEPTLAAAGDMTNAAADSAASGEAAPSGEVTAAAGAREVDPEMVEYVRGERARLEKLLSQLGEGESGKHTFRNLTLKPKGEDSVEFEFLGQDQYRVIVPVTAGRQTYKVNSWKFRRTIPADDNGERYVFVFDARRLSRPRLVMYPEYLLPKLD